jgi:hypothetical protein
MNGLRLRWRGVARRRRAISLSWMRRAGARRGFIPGKRGAGKSADCKSIPGKRVSVMVMDTEVAMIVTDIYRHGRMSSASASVVRRLASMVGSIIAIAAVTRGVYFRGCLRQRVHRRVLRPTLNSAKQWQPKTRSTKRLFPSLFNGLPPHTTARLGSQDRRSFCSKKCRGRPDLCNCTACVWK